MAISPEVKPRVSVTTDYDAQPTRSSSTESRNARMESQSSTTMGYVIGLIVLLVLGYLAYSYYGQPITTSTMTNQSTTKIAPPVVAPVAPAVTAPDATAPAVTVPDATAPKVIAPDATAPAAPVTPPVTTTP